MDLEYAKEKLKKAGLRALAISGLAGAYLVIASLGSFVISVTPKWFISAALFSFLAYILFKD